MLIGQTMFSVRHGTEHRAERALQELAGFLQGSAGHTSHRVLRSFGMSPLGSALRDEGREAVLGDVHFVFETEWDSLQAHDDFYQSERVRKNLRQSAVDLHQRPVRGPLRRRRGGAPARQRHGLSPDRRMWPFRRKPEADRGRRSRCRRST